MSKSDIKLLVDTLGADLVSEESFKRNLNVVLLELAETPARTRARVIEPISPGDSRISLPDELVHLLGAFYDNRQLDDLNQQQLRATHGPNWRSLRGAPTAFTREEENERNFRLVPIPTRPSELPLIPLWSPLGADMAIGAVTVIATEFHDQKPGTLDHLDVWVALAVLARATSEDSPRRDMEMSQAFQACADGLRSLLGL